jgi:hypothetical protein
MLKLLTSAAAAGLLAITMNAAHAAPIQGAPGGVTAPQSSVDLVHGFHRECRRGPRGWHRHNKFGERRPCRAWRGQGRRPDVCVKVGPIFYCDY